MHGINALAGLLLVLLTSGCSMGNRLAYDNLDTLFALELDDYVELDTAQEARLDAVFQPLWHWHRSSELPAYAQSLRELAAVLDATNPEPLVVDAFSSRFEAHGERLQARLLSDMAPLLASLDEAQIEALLDALREKDAERIRKQTRGSLAARRARLGERIEGRLEDWLGSLTAAQQAIGAQRAATLEAEGQLSPETLQARTEKDQASLAAVLATRQQVGFELRLSEIVAPRSGAEAAEREALRERSRRNLAALAATLQPAQRAHLAKRLRGFAEDCEVLAAKAKP